jgi:hypothetical protein
MSRQGSIHSGVRLSEQGGRLTMKKFFKSLSLVFASGAFGALVNSAVLWLFGRAGITAQLGVKLAPSFTHGWLYPRLVKLSGTTRRDAPP